MGLSGWVHGRIVYGRRVERLVNHLAGLVPDGSRVLDVGCGDGLISSLISQRTPGISMCGIDVLVRPDTHIRVEPFDGRKIPFGNGAFDVVLFVDVLHHTQDPLVLLQEASRVAKQAIIIKDHLMEGLLSRPTLRFMDRVGNIRHGVSLPYNYMTRQQWMSAIQQVGWQADVWKEDLALYPWWADWLFGRSLHFVAKFSKKP